MAPRAARRDQLAAIAADLFAREGYHAVSVNDIAAAAGLSGPAIYRHFPGKQAVLACVLLGSLERLATDADAHMGAGAADPYGALAAATIAHPEFGVLWRRERRHLAPEDAALAAERMGQVERVLKAAIGAERPELSAADADLLAWAVLSVYGSIADHRVRIPGPRFGALLAEIAADVAAADLPVSDAAPPTAADPSPFETRREQLLAVASRMFWDRGFHEVTMEDIGAAAGIAGPSIYTHFAGKTDLLKTAADRIGERLRVETAEIQAAALPPEETLLRLETRFAALVIDYRDLFGAFFTEGHNLPDRDRAESRRNQRGLVDYWSQVLEAAVPGMPAKEARIRVHAAFAVANDLARTRKVARRADLGSDVRVLMDAVLRGRS